MLRCDQFSLVMEKSGQGVLVALGVLPNSTLIDIKIQIDSERHTDRPT